MLNAIWVKITSTDAAESVTSVRCDPSVTTVDDLKDLVKAKCSPKLDHIAALDLSIKDADGLLIEEDTLLSERVDGRRKATAFIVEVPAAAAGASLSYSHIQFNSKIVSSFVYINLYC